MTLHDRARRMRWTGLLLSAILVPTAVVMALGFRVVRQERELGARRASDAHRDALVQLQRELTARLQAVRLEEVNRLIVESGTRLPPASPIVFVAPIIRDRLVLPWERRHADATPRSVAFMQQETAAEGFEFQSRDSVKALDAHRAALGLARTPVERCTARVALARTYLKAGMTGDAESIDLATLSECRDVFDEDGVPLAIYAGEHLLDAGRTPAVADYVIHAINQRRWLSPNEAFALRSLVQRIPTAVAAESFQRLTLAIRDIEQITALARDLHAHPDKLQRMSRLAPGDLPWLGYGDEPWLVTVVSPTSFAAPVVMVVSSRRIVPSGATLRHTIAQAADPLGEGFVDLYVQWPEGRFTVPPAPVALYGAAFAVLLVAVLLAGYSVLRDVQRESHTALMRSSFVASVSHELKTPLTSIRAHAETLLMGRTPDPQTASDYLKTIVSESERLTRLVESVLAFSRIEQGRKVYQMRPIRLDDVVCAAVRTLKYPMEQLGFTLTITNDATAPTLSGDPEALTGAILNLLNNAMKYSGAARRIEMRIGTRDGDACVDVVDYGIGIAFKEQSRIFDRFYRVRSAETAGIAGAGLGLALALHVVEAHHGRIEIVSDTGRGSTFSMRIPMDAVQA